ncbi:hypothetical protein FF80_02853 [Devosia sp. LC5]|nr:hypothetical protein FF80_02853 [Devosia sp. LC5]
MKQILLGLAVLAPFAMPAFAASPAPDSLLCRSQLELLQSRQKLTPSEAAVYEAQCACLEQREQTGQPRSQTSCAQGAPQE